MSGEDPTARDPGTSAPGGFPVRSLATVAVLVVVASLVVVLTLPRGGTPGPGDGTSSPGPTFNVPAALDAKVDEAGLMRSGGIWAVEGSYLLTSTDNGATWRAGTFPSPVWPSAPASVFVLDPDHAWAIASSLPGGSASGSEPPGQLFVLSRTSDGGVTWQSTPVAGDFRCDAATISFADASRGYIMCSYGAVPGPNGQNNEVRTGATQGAGTVLRTADGGASWSVAGSATGLGSGFTASDATTLWSAPDSGSSNLTGAALYLSRDSGATWSTVDLPDLPAAPAPPNSTVVDAAGPVFWDASNGAFAISVFANGSGTPPADWYYRTSDAGRSWSVVKRSTLNPVMGTPLPFPVALVGREWAVIGMDGFDGLTVSADFGITWTRTPWTGMPPNSPPAWLDFTDPSHAAARAFVATGTYALLLSADGGRTWRPADFGDARARVRANRSQDPGAAASTATEFETMAHKDPALAWNMLSSYSQRAFGGEPAFEAAETALGTRTGSAFPQLSQPTQDLGQLSRANLGLAVWDDLNTFADITRAYVVTATYPGAEQQETLVVAPLSVTGDWRVWIVKGP